MLSLSFLRPTSAGMQVCPSDCWNVWTPRRLRARRPVFVQDEFDDFTSGLLADILGLSGARRDRTSTKTDSSEPRNFEMKISAGGFRPEDIKIKVQGQNLIVEAKREEKEEKDGMFSRSFREVRRSFALPENVDKKSLTSAISPEGILEIEALFLPALEEKKSDETTVEVKAEEPEQKKEIEVAHMDEEEDEEETANKE